MMRKEMRGRSRVVIPAAMLLLLMQLQLDDSKPTTYVVEDEYGWDLIIDMQSWTRGKNFHVGDLIVFNYDYQMSDVVIVNKTGHDTCTVNEGDKVLNSGSDKIAIVFGSNYFIDSIHDVWPLV